MSLVYKHYTNKSMFQRSFRIASIYCKRNRWSKCNYKGFWNRNMSIKMNWGIIFIFRVAMTSSISVSHPHCKSWETKIAPLAYAWLVLPDFFDGFMKVDGYLDHLPWYSFCWSRHAKNFHFAKKKLRIFVLCAHLIIQVMYGAYCLHIMETVYSWLLVCCWLVAFAPSGIICSYTGRVTN